MTDQLIQEIHTFCQANADPALVAKYSRYFKEGYNAWGVEGQKMEEHRKQLLQKYPALTRDDILEAGDQLMRHEKYESKSYALQLTLAFRKEWDESVLDRFGAWLEDGIDNWGHTDFLCSEGMPLFEKIGIRLVEKLKNWGTSRSIWKRRAMAVSLIKPMKTGESIPAILALVEGNMEDPARPVQQGIGWLLRECWKKDPATVEAFLLKWKDRAGRTIIQYATEKMNSNEKSRFKRSKT